jgi:hypothetical protein
MRLKTRRASPVVTSTSKSELGKPAAALARIVRFIAQHQVVGKQRAGCFELHALSGEDVSGNLQFRNRREKPRPRADLESAQAFAFAEAN